MQDPRALTDWSGQVEPGLDNRLELSSLASDLPTVTAGPVLHDHAARYPSPPMSGSASPPTRGLASPYDVHFHHSRNSSTGDPTSIYPAMDGGLRSMRTAQPIHHLHLPRATQSTPYWLSDVGEAPTSHPSLPLLQTGHPKYMPPRPMLGQRSPTLQHHPGLPSNKQPRRTKAHVTSACVNCKKAHLACDANRPCRRCVGNGKQDSCVDVQHRKRGRPRLQEERQPIYKSFGQGYPTQDSPRNPLMPSHVSPSLISHSLRNISSRSLNGDSPTALRPLQSPHDLGSVPSPYGMPNISRPTSSLESIQDAAVAYLYMDFVIARSTRGFRELLSMSDDHFGGASLFSCVSESGHERIHGLLRELLSERDARDPGYRPPMYSQSERDSIPEIQESVLAHTTQGSAQRIVELDFRLPGGHLRRLAADVRLAKASVYFVVINLLRPTGPDQSPSEPFRQPDYSRQTSNPANYGISAPVPPSHGRNSPTPSYLNEGTDRSSQYYAYQRRDGPPSGNLAADAAAPQLPALQISGMDNSSATMRNSNVSNPPPSAVYTPPSYQQRRLESPTSEAVVPRYSEPAGVTTQYADAWASRESSRDLQLPPIRTSASTAVGPATESPRLGDSLAAMRPGEMGSLDDHRHKRKRLSVQEIMD